MPLLANSDEQERRDAAAWLEKNPDVETLISKGYRLVKIPIVEFEARGFTLENPDPTGHLNVLGDATQFAAHKFDFTELIKTGQARILSVEECL